MGLENPVFIIAFQPLNLLAVSLNRWNYKTKDRFTPCCRSQNVEAA